MCDHYLIMSSSYTDGVRVALDVTDSDLICEEHISGLIAEIKKQCGEDIPLSSHLIQTESSSWDSVVHYDPFFSSVYVASSLFDFIAKVRESRILTGIDVAHYILSKIPCTYLSLEKLVYFSYADYLCGHMKCLFDDRIFAFTHGPVVQSVYEAYKRSGYRHVNRYDDGDDGKISTTVREMPAASRILFAEDGVDKICSIDDTIRKYDRLSSSELVSLTHRAGSPWSNVDSTLPYQVISDELILEHHHVDSIE